LKFSSYIVLLVAKFLANLTTYRRCLQNCNP
jgi:hypothetical protein